MKKTRKLLGKSLIVLMTFIPALLHAQPAIEDENVLDNPVPFDGGVSLLVAAAVCYGLKKAHSRKEADSV